MCLKNWKCCRRKYLGLMCRAILTLRKLSMNTGLPNTKTDCSTLYRDSQYQIEEGGWLNAHKIYSNLALVTFNALSVTKPRDMSVNYSKYKCMEARLKFVTRLRSPLWPQSFGKVDLGLHCPSLSAPNQVIYVWHPKLFITGAIVKTQRILCEFKRKAVHFD